MTGLRLPVFCENQHCRNLLSEASDSAKGLGGDLALHKLWLDPATETVRTIVLRFCSWHCLHAVAVEVLARQESPAA